MIRWIYSKIRSLLMLPKIVNIFNHRVNICILCRNRLDTFFSKNKCDTKRVEKILTIIIKIEWMGHKCFWIHITNFLKLILFLILKCLPERRCNKRVLFVPNAYFAFVFFYFSTEKSKHLRRQNADITNRAM